MQQSLVEEYMFKALVLLLEQKPYDKISITEIAKRAGVSRMSYYRNYSSKDEIITKFWEKSLPIIWRKCCKKIIIAFMILFAIIFLKTVIPARFGNVFIFGNTLATQR